MATTSRRNPRHHTSVKASIDRSDRSEVVQRSSSPTGAVGQSKAVLLALFIVVVVVHLRTFGAAFLGFDDDIHVYANPLLNPVSFESLAKMWRQPYEGLYIPLAYTILAGIAPFARVPPQFMSSIGRTATLSPGPFHVASVALHVTNVWLFHLLALRLTRSRKAALAAALVFALHPLQVESVGWLSELRGLSSGCFALASVNVFLLSRRLHGQSATKSRSWFALSALLAVCAMLCKPVAVVLPIVVLVIDRVALGTSWRSSLAAASIWGACVLPFAVMTRALQDVLPAGMSLWWQRPFVAGDALAFYLSKIILPLDLCIHYGRTPRVVLSHAWGYLAWLVPTGLLLLAYFQRRRYPIAWLGSLLLVAFFLPVLGLTPFKYQAYSTVSDRYAYLPLVGIALIAGDRVASVRSKLAVGVSWAIIGALALLSFNQTGHWTNNEAFLRHTLAVNPNVAFAHNDLGVLLLKQGRTESATEHFARAVAIEPGDAKAHNNLGLVLVQQGRLTEAEIRFRRAVEVDPRYLQSYQNLGALYLKSDRLDAAIVVLEAALAIEPGDAKALNDLGVAFMQSGRDGEGLAAFRRAVDAEPNNTHYRKNLGRALMDQGKMDEARPYLAP